MTILGIDSSATSASAAVIESGKLLSEAFINIGMTHSQTLLPLILNVLEKAGKKIRELDLIAVVTGPGSFTGIRIGVATAKGLAQAHNIPCFAVSALECIAYPLNTSNVLAVSVMDARREQVYCALFRSESGKLTRLTEDKAEKLSDLKDVLKKHDEHKILIGDGADIAYSYLRDELGNIFPANEGIRHQRASSAAYIAKYALEVEKQSPVSAALLVPSYLRVPQAERELRKSKQS